MEIRIVGVAAAAAAAVVLSSVDTGGLRYPIRGDLPPRARTSEHLNKAVSCATFGRL